MFYPQNLCLCTLLVNRVERAVNSGILKIEVFYQFGWRGNVFSKNCDKLMKYWTQFPHRLKNVLSVSNLIISIYLPCSWMKSNSSWFLKTIRDEDSRSQTSEVSNRNGIRSYNLYLFTSMFAFNMFLCKGLTFWSFRKIAMFRRM